MVTATSRYRPDYAVPPGWVLAERLEVRGISPAEFARRCGRSPKLISEIIAGKAPPQTGDSTSVREGPGNRRQHLARY